MTPVCFLVHLLGSLLLKGLCKVEPYLFCSCAHSILSFNMQTIPLSQCHLKSMGKKNHFCLKIHPRRARMSQQVNVLSTMPNDLSLTSGPHMVEGENGLPHVIL